MKAQRVDNIQHIYNERLLFLNKSKLLHKILHISNKCIKLHLRLDSNSLNMKFIQSIVKLMIKYLYHIVKFNLILETLIKYQWDDKRSDFDYENFSSKKKSFLSLI